MTNVEEMQFINSTAYTVGEEQDIALQPGYLLRRELVASSGTGHLGFDFAKHGHSGDTTQKQHFQAGHWLYAINVPEKDTTATFNFCRRFDHGFARSTSTEPEALKLRGRARNTAGNRGKKVSYSNYGG